MTRPSPGPALAPAFVPLLVAAVALTAHAHPGHSGHERAPRDHVHRDHDHGEDDAAALRAPIAGNWIIDHAATIDLMAKSSSAIAKADRGALTRQLAQTVGDLRMAFAPDGGVLMGEADAIKRGLYVVQAGADGALTLLIYDTTENTLVTSEYAARVEDGHLHLTHAGDTMVLRRPTAAEAQPARAESPAAPTAPGDPRLVGRWTVDLDRTLAAHVQIEKLTAEQRTEALAAMTGFFGKMVYTFDAEGGTTLQNGGPALPARYRVVARRGDHLELELTDPNGTYPVSVDLDGRYMRFSMKRGDDPTLLVLVRQ